MSYFITLEKPLFKNRIQQMRHLFLVILKAFRILSFLRNNIRSLTFYLVCKNNPLYFSFLMFRL